MGNRYFWRRAALIWGFLFSACFAGVLAAKWLLRG